MTYLLLFWEFFKTGLFAVGGGLATLPFLREIAIHHPHWFSLEALADIIAIAESTPGPVGVNASTYAGYQACGILGALVATFALILPSFCIIFFISKALKKYRDNRYVNRVFYSLRPAVTGLIGASGYSVIRLSFLGAAEVTSFAALAAALDWRAVLLFAVLLTAMQIKWLKKIHPVLFIAAGAVAGILFL